MNMAYIRRALVALKHQVDSLEQEAEPLPRTLILKPGDEVPEDIADYDSVISFTRETEAERDLSGCNDVLTVTVKQPRRPLIITRGSADKVPRVESVEPSFSE